MPPRLRAPEHARFGIPQSGRRSRDLCLRASGLCGGAWFQQSGRRFRLAHLGARACNARRLGSLDRGWAARPAAKIQTGRGVVVRKNRTSHHGRLRGNKSDMAYRKLGPRHNSRSIRIHTPSSIITRLSERSGGFGYHDGGKFPRGSPRERRFRTASIIPPSPAGRTARTPC